MRSEALELVREFFFRDHIDRHDIPVLDGALLPNDRLERCRELPVEISEPDDLLLSAQGDRMLMGNSVEGRFPFLDHRLIEQAARLPDRFKLKGLVEKHLLKRLASRWVPPAVIERTKFPYRAPISEALTGPSAPTTIQRLFDRAAVDRVGVFDAGKVGRLVSKLASSSSLPSEADNMALMAVASTQLLAEAFLEQRPVAADRVEAVEVLVA